VVGNIPHEEPGTTPVVENDVMRAKVGCKSQLTDFPASGAVAFELPLREVDVGLLRRPSERCSQRVNDFTPR
jgi:hypothetical protein